MLLRLALSNVGDDGNDDDAPSASLCLAASVPLRTIVKGGRREECLSACVTCGVRLGLHWCSHVVGTWLQPILSIDMMDDQPKK